MSGDGPELELLLPDRGLLELALPGHQDLTYKVLANTRDVCTCLVHPQDVDPETSPSPAIILRLETTDGQLEKVAAIQSIAELAVPDLIPHLKELGSTVLQSGRKVQYFVTEYVGGCVVLDTIRNTLSSTQQLDIMRQVIVAMTRLHTLDLDGAHVQEHGKAATKLCTTSAVLGSPSTGFFPDVPAFLAKLIADNSSKKETSHYSITTAEDGVVFGTDNNGEISPQLTFSFEVLAQLEKSLKICHNDLEPRNLLVRVKKQDRHDTGTETSASLTKPSTSPTRSSVSPSTKDTTYELAAILDWEVAGILPFSYEYALKDRSLGGANLYRSWYTLFKTHTLPLLLRDHADASEADRIFMEMLQKIWDKRERRMTRNVGIVFRGRWMQREGMVRGVPAWKGFVGTEGEGEGKGERKVYGKEDDDALLNEALVSLGRLQACSTAGGKCTRFDTKQAAKSATVFSAPA